MVGDSKFGLWLRKWRPEGGLTQRQLTDLADADLSRRWSVEIEANRAEPTLSAACAVLAQS